MAHLKETYANEICDYLLGNGAPTAIPATLYLALYTTAPTATAGGTEVTNAGSYARVQVDTLLGTVSAGVIQNTSIVAFAEATANWGAGAIVAAGVTDNAAHATGTEIMWCPLSSSKTVDSGETFEIAVGALTFTVA